MDIKYTCPLGSECEEAKDGKLYRCRWFVKLCGKDPQSEKEVDEFRCTMEWMPLLMVEQSLFERQTGAAVESLRNQTIAQGAQLIGQIVGMKQNQQSKISDLENIQPKLVNEDSK